MWELKLARQQLYLASRTLNFGTWTWDRQSGNCLLSKRALAAAGLAEGQLLDWSLISGLLSADDRQKLITQFKDLLSGWSERIELEFHATLPSGEVRRLYCLGSPAGTGEHARDCITGILVDTLDERRIETRMALLGSELERAEIRATRYQVNQHFLFNSLSSIATLILDGGASEAEKMALKLANFYRSSIQRDPFERISLSEEMELLSLYLDVEKIRFPDELAVAAHIPDDLREALVPCLLLQPLVENSIKYGLGAAGSRMTIEISAAKAGDRLVLTVSDDGAGGNASVGTGLGLDVTKRRLAMAYSNDFACDAGPLPGRGFRVSLSFPLQMAASSLDAGGGRAGAA